MAADKPTSNSTTTEPKKTTRVKPAEILKVAYTRPNDATGITQLVIFGTDADRSDFLREHTDEWWRIADLAKGEILAQPNGPVKSNG